MLEAACNTLAVVLLDSDASLDFDDFDDDFELSDSLSVLWTGLDVMKIFKAKYNSALRASQGVTYTKMTDI